jgi:hypothetical protein
VLDDSLLAQAFRLIGLDPAQGFKQYVGVLAQQGGRLSPILPARARRYRTNIAPIELRS